MKGAFNCIYVFFTFVFLRLERSGGCRQAENKHGTMTFLSLKKKIPAPNDNSS